MLNDDDSEDLQGDEDDIADDVADEDLQGFNQCESGGLASNDSLDHFRSSIEPVGGFR